MLKQFIENLIKSMTLEEKLAQMTQLAPLFFNTEDSMALTGPAKEMNIYPGVMKNIGSTLNAFGAQKLCDMQDKNLRENPHNIPLMFMADVIHGYKTIFPIPLAMGCSFNPDAYEKAAEVAAKESAASGIHLTFSPMTDLVRDPRWGRVMESTGEDPYLNSLMAAAAVRGFQGDDLKKPGKIAACVKHFAGYGAPEGGREYNTVDISSGILYDYYLPAYKAAVEAGVAMVMTSFNTIMRVPATVNKKLLRDILRKKWGFKGVVISDFSAVAESIAHGLASNGEEAAKMSIQAGVDIEMMSTHYLNNGKQLVEEGKIQLSQIDKAVRRILELKDALGLFENPYKDASPEKEKELHLCAEHRKAARDIAAQSVVLLKNDNVLPLKKGMKIGLAGPFAVTPNILGGWSSPVKKEAVGLYEGLAKKVPEVCIKTAMTDALGPMQAGIFDIEDKVQEACDELRDCDILIAAVGENPDDTGEGASKACIRLSPNQEKLVWELKKLGKPVVVVVFSGRPMEIKPVLDSADALVQAWFLGTESGNALADILFGDYNPSARLSMSFPQTVGQIPVYYNCFNTGRPYYPSDNPQRYVSRYLDCPNEPLFCFGYGLSYSDFVYSDFEVKQDGEITASVSVENCSEIAGKETVQLYIRDVAASVTRPLKELKAFRQITLLPHERVTVTFTVTKNLLKFHNSQLEFIFEPGEFDIMIGKNSNEVYTKRVYVS
jgi:beta-glucosidase